jgi:hypothetical protein
LAASHASNTFTISPISQSRSVTLAAIAGVVRSVYGYAQLRRIAGTFAQGVRTKNSDAGVVVMQSTEQSM